MQKEQDVLMDGFGSVSNAFQPDSDTEIIGETVNSILLIHEIKELNG